MAIVPPIATIKATIADAEIAVVGAIAETAAKPSGPVVLTRGIAVIRPATAKGPSFKI